MTLFHKIALAAALVALPQIARGQEAPLDEQIARDVVNERQVCRDTYKTVPKAETCFTEVEGAEMLLNQYTSSLNALEISIRTALFFLNARIRDATNGYMTGRPLPMPPLPGESEWETANRKSGYHQQAANADIAKMTAERQCIADKAMMDDTTKTLRGHYEWEFGQRDKQFPFLQRFPSYGAVKTAMFAMLDRYQKEVDAISCAVVR